MPTQNNHFSYPLYKTYRRPGLSYRHRIFLITLGIAFSVIEFFLPRVPLFPWLKPGLFGSILVIWVIKLGFKEALTLVLMRLLITGLYFGFSFFTMLLSVSGGFLAAAVMSLGVLFYKKNRIGLSCLSILGALAHNTGQFIVLASLSKMPYLFRIQIPAAAAASAVTGFITAGAAHYIYNYIGYQRKHISYKDLRLQEPQILKNRIKTDPNDKSYKSPPELKQKILFLLFIILSFSLAFINSLTPVFTIFPLIILFTALRFKSLGSIFKPLRVFWMFFLSMILLQLIRPYGYYFNDFPLLTIEGVKGALLFSLKIWIWLLTAMILKSLGFNDLLLNKMVSSKNQNALTIQAAFYVSYHFPALLTRFKRDGFKIIKKIFRSPQGALYDVFRLINGFGI